MTRSRRELLAIGAAGALTSFAQRPADIPVRYGVPRVAISKQRGAVLFSASWLLGFSGLRPYDGCPVFIGIQAEGLNWMSADPRFPYR